MKIAIKREQSQACLSYAEREQFGATLKTTMKRRYEKPAMKIYELQQRTAILVGSDPDWYNEPGGPQQF